MQDLGRHDGPQAAVAQQMDGQTARYGIVTETGSLLVAVVPLPSWP